MKVIRQGQAIGQADKMLLQAVIARAHEYACIRGRTSLFIHMLLSRLKMNYNQLKIRVLNLFDLTKELQSDEVLKMLSRDSSSRFNDKAVEMALLRYWRQGLLSRSRRGGRFQYKLTEKGEARKNWLLKSK